MTVANNHLLLHQGDIRSSQRVATQIQACQDLTLSVHIAKLVNAALQAMSIVKGACRPWLVPRWVQIATILPKDTMKHPEMNQALDITSMCHLRINPRLGDLTLGKGCAAWSGLCTWMSLACEHLVQSACLGRSRHESGPGHYKCIPCAHQPKLASYALVSVHAGRGAYLDGSSSPTPCTKMSWKICRMRAPPANSEVGSCSLRPSSISPYRTAYASSSRSRRAPLQSAD